MPIDRSGHEATCGLRLRCAGALALLCAALASGCAKDQRGEPPPPMVLSEPVRTVATGPFKATGWTDASGKTMSADEELAAKTRCAERIRDASTDQIHIVPARDIDDCLVAMGWKRLAAK